MSRISTSFCTISYCQSRSQEMFDFQLSFSVLPFISHLDAVCIPFFFRATLPPGKWLSLQYISHSGKGRWIQLYKIGCTVQHLCLYSTGWGCVEGLWLRLGTKLDARKCLKGPRNCKNKLGDWVRSFCLENIHLSKIVFLVVFLL